MEKVPYITNTSSVKGFLQKIQETGEPSKVTQAHLESIGFASKNDRPLISLFKYIGFLDTSGVPTDRYRKYRSKKNGPRVLAVAIKSAYSGLFATYPDAYRRDVEALADYFRTQTGLGERTVGVVVSTFKELCENADFEGLEEGIEDQVTEDAKSKGAEKRTPASRAVSPEIVINIQLQLPLSEKEEVYDKLFASLRKNLIQPCNEEK